MCQLCIIYDTQDFSSPEENESSKTELLHRYFFLSLSALICGTVYTCLGLYISYLQSNKSFQNGQAALRTKTQINNRTNNTSTSQQ